MPKFFLKNNDWLDLQEQDPTIYVDLRYATSNNFLGYPHYPKNARAYLRRPVAEAVIRVNKRLKKYGYSLLIFDAYRPYRTTVKFWYEVKDLEIRSKYLANPKYGSLHNRGCAIDVSLYDPIKKKELEMPTPFDEFSRRAFADDVNCSERARLNRSLLQSVFLEEGFQIFPNEWWHFNWIKWRDFAVVDIDFSTLKKIKSDH